MSRDLFPATADELAAMCCCYLLTAAFAVIVTVPHVVFACAMRACGIAARILGA